MEIAGAAQALEYYAGLARTVTGRSMALGDDVHGVVLRESVGVVGIIIPWNWPISLLIRSLAPALAAGNAVVVKPASLTAAITIACLARLSEVDEAAARPGDVRRRSGRGDRRRARAPVRSSTWSRSRARRRPASRS